MSDERYESLHGKLVKDSQKVTTLRGEQVNPAQVSKAVLLLQELDREIRLKTRNKRSLDDVLRGAMHLECRYQGVRSARRERDWRIFEGP